MIARPALICLMFGLLLLAACQSNPTQPPPVSTALPSPRPVSAVTEPPAPTPEPAAGKADWVLKNGLVYTVDRERTVAQAVAIKGDTIVYVGDDAGAEAFVADGTQVIDLQGKMVLPGFIDSHAHADSGADEVYSVILNGLNDVTKYEQAIRDFLAAHPEATALQGGGWINPLFPPSGPTKEFLDELVPDIPAVLGSEDYHSVWVNSKALELAGITADTPDPEGGIIERDADGNPSGTLRETAVELVAEVIPPYAIDQLVEGLKYFQDTAHSYGITAVHIPHLSGGNAEAFDALRQLEDDGKLTLRVVAALGVEPGNDPSVVDRLVTLRDAEQGGLFEIKTAKIFMDGVVEGSTAYLEEPYVHMPESRGELLWDPDRFNAMCAALDKAGFQIHVHAIGDAAVRITLDGMAYARQANGTRDARPGITHLQLVSPADVKRFAELGVVAVPQPYWFVVDDYYYQAVDYLGQERADQQYPMKSFFDAGVVVASSSDYPVTIPPRPLDAIECGVTRAWMGETDPSQVLVPAERVGVEDMIASFTINGAYAYFLEDVTGSLEVGKKADLIVLDSNLLQLEPSKIHEAQVLLTLFDGREVFRHESFR